MLKLDLGSAGRVILVALLGTETIQTFSSVLSLSNGGQMGVALLKVFLKYELSFLGAELGVCKHVCGLGSFAGFKVNIGCVRLTQDYCLLEGKPLENDCTLNVTVQRLWLWLCVCHCSRMSVVLAAQCCVGKNCSTRIIIG